MQLHIMRRKMKITVETPPIDGLIDVINVRSTHTHTLTVAVLGSDG